METYINPKLTLAASTDVEPGAITWRSPSNLAIVKYWGKHGNQLPRNPSISLTLESAFTETIFEYGPQKKLEPGVSLQFFFEGEPNPAFEKRVKTFLDSLLPIFPFLEQLELTIHSENSFPHSTGIASSASSMSALALCLCSLEHELFETLDDDTAFDRKASYIARLGSGSACRSIFPNLALWGQTGEVDGSSDLYAVPMAEYGHPIFQSMHDDILLVSASEKEVSSSAGHGLMDQHPFAEVRYQQARQRIQSLLSALRLGDVEEFGRIAENEALTLHGLMMSSNPSYMLMHPNTIALIEKIRRFRQEKKIPVYFSLDAGPNIHLLYPESVMHETRLFLEEELLPLCDQKRYLPDWVGEGPIQEEV